MSLLLKRVWRGVLRAGSATSSTRPSRRSLSSSSASSPTMCPELHETSLTMRPTVLSEATLASGPSGDAVMASIKHSFSARDVLAAVQANLPAVTHKHHLQALRSIFNLQKANNFQVDKDSIIKDPSFGVLCQNIQKQVRTLDVNEVIEATKILTYLGVPADSLLVQSLLQMIRCQINLLNIRQIMFLDFLLSKFDSENHLVAALKLALPLAFQIHLPLELDKQDFHLLKDMLFFCSSHKLPDKYINNVVTGLLLHDQEIDANVANSIIWWLCKVNCTEEKYPTRVQLLHICYDILAQHLDELTYDEVLRTVVRIQRRLVLSEHPEYYHEQLMDAVAGYAVKNDVGFEKGLLIARILSRIKHTNFNLLQYLCKLADCDTEILTNARTNILFGFINCLANCNYTPQPHVWTNLRKQISLNPVLNAKNAALPWIKFCLELASLGHYEDNLLSRVFEKQFLDQFLASENTLDYLQVLTLHAAVRCFHSSEHKLPEEVFQKARAVYRPHRLTDQLGQYLSRGLGGPEYVCRNVELPNGLVADLLICMKAGYPVQLPPVDSNVTKTPISMLNIPPDAINVCIMNFSQGCFSLNSNRLRGRFRLILDILEKEGYAVVAINANELLSAPPHERTPYLIREIGYKCGEIGNKLTAG